MGLEDYKKIHFVGIGGIGMSGLAMILLKKGYNITGSDREKSFATERLEAAGIKVSIGTNADNIDPDTELVVYTAAAAEDNPELVRARESGMRLMGRAELLGMITAAYKYPVCVSGMHGKTTVSSMITQILLSAGYDPSVSVGGVIPIIDGNYRLGASDYFVAEACEYQDSFLELHPHIGVILNIEPEHMDYFTDIRHIRRSFRHFAKNIPSSGALLISRDIPDLNELLDGLKCRVATFGTDTGSDGFSAADIGYDQEGFPSYDLMHNGRKILRVKLNVYGLHNVFNSIAAASAALLLGVSTESISDGLYSFTGAKRRAEVKGRLKNGVTVIDDYAHHPTEIKAFLKSAREMLAARPGGMGRVYCVFQPHTYSRTIRFFHELGASFADADEVLVLDIFSAREEDSGKVHSRELAEEIRRHGNARYFSSFGEAQNFLFDNCVPNDLLITMGAGNVYLLGEEMLRTDLSTLSTIL